MKVYVLRQRREMPEDRVSTSGQKYWEDVCAVSDIQTAMDWHNGDDRTYVALELDPETREER